MSNELITYVVAGLCGLLIIAAFTWLIVLPVWNSYTRVWERIAASFLSLYVLVALVMAGVAGGAAVIYFWDTIAA
jgi:hypothetical protein